MEQGMAEKGFLLSWPGNNKRCQVDLSPCPLIPAFMDDKNCSHGTSCPKVVKVKNSGRWKGKLHFKM